MNKFLFQKHLFAFYSKAIQSYQDKIINDQHSIGADELMDVLFSYGIRHKFLLNADFIETSKKYFNDDFEPHVRVEAIIPNVEMQLHDYQMGQLYFDVINEKYMWVGSTGLLQERTFTEQSEAIYVFTQELKYQMLSIHSVIESTIRHGELIRHYVDNNHYGETYALLYYLNFSILEDIWDNENNKKWSLALIKRFVSAKLSSLNLLSSEDNQAWLIEYYKMKTRLDVHIFSMEQLYTILKDTKDLRYPETPEPIFPRFDIHHESILMNALGDDGVSGEYQGELLQYFMVLYPYMRFEEWNHENAQHLLLSGQKMRAVIQKHLGINMEDSFTLEDLKHTNIPKIKYLAMMHELTPELRVIFYDKTKERFEVLAKDIEFVGNMFSYVDPVLQNKFNIHSQIWNLNIDKWLSMNSFDTCQKRSGEHFQPILIGQLHRLGYTPKKNETLQDMYMILTHFVTLNHYMNESDLSKGIFRISKEKMSAALWLKLILIYPKEFSLEDFVKHEPIIKKGRLQAILNSSVFQKIMDKNGSNSCEEEIKKDKPTRTL